MDQVGVRWVDSAGVRLAVREAGDPGAPTVVLVHGFPDNCGVWDGVVQRLRGRFHVVRYDVRGAGGSGEPDGRAGYRLDVLAGDLAAVARAVSPDAPVHLVGHDWGSVQGWHAVTEPELADRFASFTSISGPCVDHVAYWMRARVRRGRVLGVLGQLAHSWYIAAFQVPLLPELVWRIPGLRARFHAESRDLRNGLELYRANMFGPAATPRRTSVPVQQIVLTEDHYVRPAVLAAADRWCTRLWRRELVAAHWAPRTHPARVAEMVSEFVLHGGPRTHGRFAGKLALVTGAGSGIGRASALAFAAEGADVVAVDIDEASAGDTAREAAAHGGRSAACRTDVADPDAVRALAARVRDEYGVPDIVLAGAGIGLAGGFLATSEQDWRRMLDVNLLGVVHTLRAFAPMLVDRQRGGHLVLTASAAAFTPWPALSAYAASKAAVLSLAQSLRTELAPHRIGVSAICPGIVATGITASTTFAGLDAAAEQRARRAATRAYRRRNYRPERVAVAVLDAVERNTAVRPVTPEAVFAAWLARISPAAVRAVGKWVRPPG